MAKLEKRTCSRCGGSGNYSFNLIDGTKCYGCNGAGFVMVNVKNEERNAKVKEIKRIERERVCKINRDAYNAVIKEMNPIYGPFDITTQKGVHDLNYAIASAIGKGIAQIRDERLKEKS